MSTKELSDITVKENSGSTSIAGRDVTSTVVGDTTVGDIFNSVTVAPPKDDTDDKLVASLDNNRSLLKKSKRKLAVSMLSDPVDFKEVQTAIRNIKMSGDNITNLINALSVRGKECEHLPGEGNYEPDILDILNIKNKIFNEHSSGFCPHCKEKLNINKKLKSQQRHFLLRKPKKRMYIFEECQSNGVIDGFTISGSSNLYCKLCKNLVCICYTENFLSIDSYINENYPN